MKKLAPFFAPWVPLVMMLGGCLLAASWGHAATVLSGNVSGTWTLSGSPYILSADCTVVSNQTLTIQPGVEVVIVPDVSIQVSGGISAIGTPEQPIRIRGASPSNYWESIVITQSPFTNRFHYCRISEGYQALIFQVTGGNRVMSPEILNCEFLNCRDRAILGYVTARGSGQSEQGNATLAPAIHNCVFDRVGYGCTFAAFVEQPPGQSYLSPNIAGNVFKNLSHSALYVYGGGANTSHMIFANNTVVNVSKGVLIDSSDYFDVFLRNNLFVKNTNAIIVYGGPTILNTAYNCFFNNTANFNGYPGTYGLPVQNNSNGDACDLFFNIFLNPQFLDTNTFLLANNSPCIDAGDPAIADVCPPFSHGSSISDIGAYGGPDACGWLTHGFAPVITGPPATQSSCVGGSTAFQVNAQGSAPLAYRWFFNTNTVLAGETNAQLNLANLQTNQAGFYSVAVSNTFGSVTSAPARLLVFDACASISLYAGLTITGMVGRTYVVDASTNIAGPTWVPFATNTLTTPRWLVVDTNTPLNPARFFRVRLVP